MNKLIAATAALMIAVPTVSLAQDSDDEPDLILLGQPVDEATAIAVGLGTIAALALLLGGGGGGGSDTDGTDGTTGTSVAE